MDTTPGLSVAPETGKTNAIPWKSAARVAVSMALGRSGSDDDVLRWRDGRRSEGCWWASFAVVGSGDVVWAAQVDDAAPRNAHVVATPWGEVGVWRHPNDPALPGLSVAAARGGLRPWFAGVAPQVDADVVDIVTLKPLQCAAVRVGEPGAAVFVKVVPPWRLPAVAERYRAARAAGLPTPDVLAVEPGLGLIVLSELRGVTLAEHLETGAALPGADEVWSVIARLAHALGSHGDLHDRQVLLDERGSITGVVDLDDAGEGDLLGDLGRLLAHAAVRAQTRPEQRARVDAWVHDLRTLFQQRVDPEALREREAAAQARLSRLRRTEGS